MIDCECWLGWQIWNREIPTHVPARLPIRTTAGAAQMFSRTPARNAVYYVGSHIGFSLGSETSRACWYHEEGLQYGCIEQAWLPKHKSKHFSPFSCSLARGQLYQSNTAATALYVATTSAMLQG